MVASPRCALWRRAAGPGVSGTLLILGETGQLARALALAALRHGLEPVCAGRSTADLAVRGAVSARIETVRPMAVINAAAYTDVDGAEAHTQLARAINADGAAEAAEAARRAGARFVHVSTDYVFSNNGPHDETAVVRPVNAYGRTKRAGELAVLAVDPDAAVVRASGVFSGSGGDFPSAMWRLAHQGAPIRVVDDQQVTPIYACDLAERLLILAAAPDATGFFHCGGAPGASWCGVAEEALAALGDAGGPVRTVEAVTSAVFARPAARPADSRLAGTRLEQITGLRPPDWRAGLRIALEAWLTSRKDTTP